MNERIIYAVSTAAVLSRLYATLRVTYANREVRHKGIKITQSELNLRNGIMAHNGFLDRGGNEKC